MGHTGGLYGVATKMIFMESSEIGIIMFTNSEVSTQLDRFIFSIVELMLFLKAKEFKAYDFKLGEFFEIMQSNKFISEDYNINNIKI